MPAYESVSWSRRWLALDDERAGYLEGWCSINAQLERQPGWFDLSEKDRAEAELVAGLPQLDRRLRAMDRRLRHWLRSLPTAPSRDLEEVVANLSVAERLLPPEENRVVHGLISRAVRDLSRMRDRP
jgi:hypothetical protein